MVELSVVIPIYNAEKYLRKCVDSVFLQNYEDMEIILVDDGSTDGSSEICREYCERDSRFHYIYQDDRWLSASRNRGIEIAKGRYIVFLDPDDYWERDFCKTIIPWMEKDNLDVIQFDFYYEISEENKRVISFSEVTHVEEWSKNNLIENICKKWIRPKYPNTAWGKVFNKQFLLELGVKFKEDLRGYEDACFWGMIFPHITKICYIHKPLYHYVQHSDSAMHSSARKGDLFLETIRSYDYIIQSWKEDTRQQVEKIKPLLFCRRLQTAFLVVQYVYSNEEACKMLYNRYQNKILSELNKKDIVVATELYAKICNLTWKEKIMMLLFAFSVVDGEDAMIEWQEIYQSIK
ncbi:glycosyltransferase family 2 protein [Enterocloster bolteae]|uniref:glycosyltransferase family 2 protein n=1 Tax=Enterocloster bolteae TaxID=208479 RepID=UPI002A7F2C95|nr:glycosyltransferase [Enterocloster bolteae]